jgi:class 3 adenylate cyclase
VDPDEYAARGLYEPTAPNADDRLALLNWLAEHGVTIDQMVQAHERLHLTGIAGDLALRPGDRMTCDELAAQAGLTVDEVQRLTLAIGRPVADPAQRAFTAADVEAFALFKTAAQLFGEQPLLQFVRVIGSSLGRIADAAVGIFLADVETPLTRADAGELALAKANLEAIEVAKLLPGLMDVVFRALMESAIDRNRTARAESGSLVTVFMAVGFVDLVGFTPLSQSMPVAELRTIVDEFEGPALDTVASHGGRVVKLIGDEVMFVALDAVSAAEIALALVDRFGRETSVTPRGGLAVGEILTRGGDYYGPVVNVASRIADLAVPNEILVTPELRDRAEKSSAPLTFDPAGRRLLKGFDEPLELFALRRA